MSLLHRSTDTNNEAPVTDVMASNVAVSPPDMTMPSRDVQDVDDDEVREDVRIPGASAGLAVGAFLALLISAWAGIIPYVGPAFSFSADGTSSWTWNHVHAFGALLPGAVGVLACALILAAARRPLGVRSSVAFWGFILFLCGAWLTVVPIVWPVIEGGYFQAASPSRTFAYWMAYASGPGVLLAAFGAFVMGRSGRVTTTYK
jgi:hypothetical protein